MLVEKCVDAVFWYGLNIVISTGIDEHLYLFVKKHRTIVSQIKRLVINWKYGFGQFCPLLGDLKSDKIIQNIYVKNYKRSNDIIYFNRSWYDNSEKWLIIADY